MKTIMKNFTVLFAAALSLIACSGNKSSSSAQSSENNPSQSTTPSVVPSSTSSSAQPSSSSTQPSSSSVQPSNSSVKPSSSSTQPSSSSAGSSSSGGGTTNKTEYIFEAECTDLSGKRGPGYSGAATERNMASSNNERAFVTYLYAKGISVNFVIQSDKEVDDVVFKACLGGEFMEVLLDPTSYQFRIDSVTEDDITEATGAWDADFLNYYTSNPDPDHKTTIIDPWECEEIYIPAMGAQSPVGFQEFTITSHLKLYKGYTSISLITANNTNPHLGTMAAIAPVIDYISLTTDATLDMKIHKDNGQGNTYMHTK